MASSHKLPTKVMVNTIDVFIAASVAYRINDGEYVKIGSTKFDDDQQRYITNPKTDNRTLMNSVLRGEIVPTQDDIELAQQIITYYRGLSFQILKGKILKEFDKKALYISSNEQMHENDIGIVAYLPHGQKIGKEQQEKENRLYSAKKEYVDSIGKKVKLTGEVIRCVYSSSWATYYITIITDNDHVVFFSNKKNLPTDSKVTVEGKIKAHREKFQTQLHYTKVVQTDT